MLKHLVLLKHLIMKEFHQIGRDRRMKAIIFVGPLFQLVIFGYAANLDVVEVAMVVCDQDQTPESRELIERFQGSPLFQPISFVQTTRDIDPLMTRGDVGIGVVIPPGFGYDIRKGEPAKVQVFIEGTNSIKASQGMNGSTLITANYGLENLEARLSAAGYRLPGLPELVPRVWYNPDLKSRNYMVPAILGLVLMLMTMMLTSMATVREKEAGTMEQLIVTPLRPVHLILGKLLPFVMIGFVQVSIVVAVAVFWFHVPFRGSIGVLYFVSLPFLMNTLGIGLLISTLSSTQQQAMMMSMFMFMMPMIYFSGFVFPIESMPGWVQPVCYLIPLKYFLSIVRGIFLRGVGLEVLWPDALSLAFLGLTALSLAVFRFRKTID